MQLYDLKETKERVILVGVQADDNEDTEKSLDELEELAQTAGAETVGRIIQNREQIHPGTYVGKGKLDEIKNLLWETDATGIICDDELSPAQLGNLQDALLNRELKDVKRHREVTREQRSRNHIPVIAIVGYTNAGKSTLLNRLTGASVLEEDKLFATLDPTTRGLKLPSGQEVLLTDTVGFIRKLPHHLIEAFKSTLEEAKYADMILHVVDVSNPQMDEQMYTVYETLQNLDVKDKVVITAFNKQDRLTEVPIIRDFKADHIANISARTGQGLDALQSVIEQILRERKIEISRTYSYADAGKIQLIRKYGELLEEEYREDGIFVHAFVPKELYGKIEGRE